MSPNRHAAWLGLVVLFAGCQSRLNVDKTFHLDSGAAQSFEIDPPRFDEKVSLAVETDAPLTVQFYLKKDADAVEKELALKQKSDKMLATWSGDGKGTLAATVPAHDIPVVRIEAGPKPANVQIHIVGG